MNTGNEGAVRNIYNDWSMEKPDKMDENTTKSNFPVRLHWLITEAEKDGQSHIISWMPHGRSFAIHNPKHFVEKILPLWFSLKKAESFQRQMNIYGFRRLKSGPDRGSYFHEFFLRGKDFLARRIPRTGGTKIMSKSKTPPSYDCEHLDAPDFYRLPYLPASTTSSCYERGMSSLVNNTSLHETPPGAVGSSTLDIYRKLFPKPTAGYASTGRSLTEILQASAACRGPAKYPQQQTEKSKMLGLVPTISGRTKSSEFAIRSLHQRSLSLLQEHILASAKQNPNGAAGTSISSHAMLSDPCLGSALTHAPTAAFTPSLICSFPFSSRTAVSSSRANDAGALKAFFPFGNNAHSEIPLRENGMRFSVSTISLLQELRKEPGHS